MFLLRNRYVFMDEANDGTTTSAGGSSSGDGSAGTASTAANGGGAASGAGGDGNAGAGANTGASALTGGSDATAATAGTASTDFIPEKYRVTKEDGSFDLDASARKVEAARSELEKRLGTGGAAPKTPEEYTTTVPDSFKDMVNLDEDASYKEVRSAMHGLGLTQKQFDGVMNEYWKIAPALVGAGGQLSAEACTAELGKLWTDPTTSKANFKHALTAATRVGSIAGVSMEEIESSGLANNPAFIRMMAALGPEFSEDTAHAGGGGVLQTENGVQELMRSEAYTNEKHPKHAETVAKVRTFFNRQHGNTPVV